MEPDTEKALAAEIAILSQGEQGDRVSFETLRSFLRRAFFHRKSRAERSGSRRVDALPAGGLPTLMKNAAAKIENRVGDVALILDSTEHLTVHRELLPHRFKRCDRKWLTRIECEPPRQLSIETDKDIVESARRRFLDRQTPEALPFAAGVRLRYCFPRD